MVPHDLQVPVRIEDLHAPIVAVRDEYRPFAVDALNETLIVFTSDHGDALGDHGLSYKGFFYDCMVHVPLIIRGPGVPSGQRSPALVSTLDLVPLFYRACDAELPRSLQGEDITPLFANPTGSIRDAVFSEIQGRTMVMTREYKYVHYADGEETIVPATEPAAGGGFDTGEGSNNWVVGASLCASGKPILATDPHNGVELSRQWYQAQVYRMGSENVPKLI